MAGVTVRQMSPRQVVVKGKPLFCFELGHPLSKHRICVGARSLEGALAWEDALRRAANVASDIKTSGQESFKTMRLASMASIPDVESEEDVSLFEEEMERVVEDEGDQVNEMEGSLNLKTYRSQQMDNTPKQSRSNSTNHGPTSSDKQLDAGLTTTQSPERLQ